jgi:hypothetical protein
LDEPDRLFHRRRVLPFITSGKQVRLDIAMHDSEHRIILILETKVSFPLFSYHSRNPSLTDPYEALIPPIPSRASASGQGSSSVSRGQS